jgi:anthranilate/para-aminobenzoate synthase component I
MGINNSDSSEDPDLTKKPVKKDQMQKKTPSLSDELPIFNVLKKWGTKSPPCALLWGPAGPLEFISHVEKLGWTGLMATELEEIDWATVERIHCGISLKSQEGFHGFGGVPYILGLISYDDYSQSVDSTDKARESKSRAFIVKKGWKLIDWKYGIQVWKPIGTDVMHLHDFHIFADPSLKVKKRGRTGNPQSGLSLESHFPKDDYLKAVQEVLEAIRDGEYYQLNLLRYFKVHNVTRERLFSLFTQRSGPMGSWIQAGDLEIFSLSPERMLQVSRQGNNVILQANPIKGTTRRGETSYLDLELARNLIESPKNRAELAMIVDLMRNDFQRVCSTGTVNCQDFKLQTLANVHHLVGQVNGILKSNLTYGELFQKLLPGGSITGAPKIAVMKAIRKLERRPRGYFMGHTFLIDSEGNADCSILIRTMVRRGDDVSSNWEFAAGSGIVIQSNPDEEWDEIEAKASILTG